MSGVENFTAVLFLCGPVVLRLKAIRGVQPKCYFKVISNNLVRVVAKLTFNQVYSFLVFLFVSILRDRFFWSLLHNFVNCLHLQNKNCKTRYTQRSLASTPVPFTHCLLPPRGTICISLCFILPLFLFENRSKYIHTPHIRWSPS